MRVCVRVHMHACACVCVYIYMCILFAVGVVCTLEKVIWALVHGQVCMIHRCFFVFDTKIHICEHTRCRLCTCVYMRICMHIHLYTHACGCTYALV